MIVLYKLQPAYEQKRGLNLFSATKTFGAFFFYKIGVKLLQALLEYASNVR